MFETEVQFSLPKGYLDAEGQLHREGVMRLATAADEILPLKDPRVQQNPAYLTVIVLSRVITSLGSLADVNTKVIEGLFASDLNYLQALYERLNGQDSEEYLDTAGAAPLAGQSERSLEHIEERFGVVGGSMKAYPARQLYEEMAFIAYHFNWSNVELMSMEHAQRRRWCREISAINRELNGSKSNPFDLSFR